MRLRRKHLIILTVLLILVIGVLGYTSSTALPNKPIIKQSPVSQSGPTISFGRDPDINLETLAIDINQERVQNNLPSLLRDPALDHSAQDKCDDMVSKDYWSHNAPDGTAPWVFIDKYNDYSYAGENLAYGWPTADSISDGWMESPEHRENILMPQFDRVGYAQCKYKQDSQFGPNTLVVQHFIKQG